MLPKSHALARAPSACRRGPLSLGTNAPCGLKAALLFPSLLRQENDNTSHDYDCCRKQWVWFWMCFSLPVVKGRKRGVLGKHQETRGRGISYVIASPYSAAGKHISWVPLMLSRPRGCKTQSMFSYHPQSNVLHLPGMEFLHKEGQSEISGRDLHELQSQSPYSGALNRRKSE